MLVVVGLALGAAGVGVAFFVRDRLAARHAQVPPEAAAGTPAAEAKPENKPKPPPKPRPSTAPPEKRFEFYEMLPNFEVVVPEQDKDVRRDTTPAPVDVPGAYVLQAGSYGSFAEADKVKARLALLGISSQIQKITVDDRQYNRVRIGPIDDLGELNRTRKRLRDAKIDVLVIRVGE
jgi:cell division protein FtsN